MKVFAGCSLKCIFKTLLLFIFSDAIRLHYLTNTRIKSDSWFLIGPVIKTFYQQTLNESYVTQFQ